MTPRVSTIRCGRVRGLAFGILRTAAYITATVAARALHAFPLCATPYGVRVLGLPCGGSAAAPLPLVLAHQRASTHNRAYASDASGALNCVRQMGQIAFASFGARLISLRRRLARVKKNQYGVRVLGLPCGGSP